jgi:hypothetical protein
MQTVNSGKNAIMALLGVFVLMGIIIGFASYASDKIYDLQTINATHDPFNETGHDTTPDGNASRIIELSSRGFSELAQNQVQLSGIIILFILITMGFIGFAIWQYRK